MQAVAPNTGAEEKVLAKDQPEYTPLPVAKYLVSFAEGHEPAQALLTRWTFTDEERAKIAAGEDLYIACLTFGNPLQPLLAQVGPDSDTNWQQFEMREVPE